MKTYELGTGYRRSDSYPYVEFYKQPLFWWLVARLYHYVWERLTDPIMNKISTRAEEKHYQKLETQGEDDNYIPLTNRRDIKCFTLIHKRRTGLAVAYLTKEQRDAIATGVVPQGEERIWHVTQKPLMIDEESTE